VNLLQHFVVVLHTILRHRKFLLHLKQVKKGFVLLLWILTDEIFDDVIFVSLSGCIQPVPSPGERGGLGMGLTTPSRKKLLLRKPTSEK